MNTQKLVVASLLTLASGVVLAQAPASTSKLIVVENNPAAASSCSTIMLRAATVPGLPSDLVVKASKASTRFQNMFVNSLQQFHVSGDQAGYKIAINASSTTNQRINNLPPAQRNGEILRAADQCMSVL